MGTVKKQAFGNLILNYLGYALGSVNYIILMPLFFSTEEIGLMRLFNTYGIVIGMFVTLGSYSALIRYYSRFQTPDGKHGGLIPFMYLLTLGGFLLFAGAYWAGEPFIRSLYAEKSPLFNDYYYWLMPLVFFSAVFLVAESQASVIYQTLLSVFLREVFLRAVFALGIGLYVFKFIDFTGFVFLFVASFAMICLWQGWALNRSGRFSGWSLGTVRGSVKEIFYYSSTATLSNLVIQLIVNIDTMMLSTMAGLATVGVYGIFLNIAILISIPTRAILKVTMPMLTEAWNRQDYNKIRELYEKTAVLQTLASGIIYLTVICNERILFYFLKTEAYSDHFFIYQLLGLGYFINALFGVNNYIIHTSPYFRYDFYFNTLLLAINLPLCYWGIRLAGGEGAAGAFCFTQLIANTGKWYFIKRKFKMDIFSLKYFYIFAIIAILLAAHLLLPVLENVYSDSLIRTSALWLLYLGFSYRLNISPDFNQAVIKGTQKFK